MSLEERLKREAEITKRRFQKSIDDLTEKFMRIHSNIVFLRERAYFRTEPYREEDDVNLRALYFIPNILIEKSYSCVEKTFLLNSIKEVYSRISESIRNIFEDTHLDEYKRKKTAVALYKHTKNSLKGIISVLEDKDKKEDFKLKYGVEGLSVLNQYFNSIKRNFFSKSILFFSRKLVEEIESLGNQNSNETFKRTNSIIDFYSFFFEDIKRMNKTERITVKTFFERTKDFYDSKGYESVSKIIESRILSYF